ncbi:uncharacterized protein RBU47_012438 isoform 3-T3 [Passerculus sandwichensis]
MDGSGATAAAGPSVPNLTPRHRQLIPTPCGPIKPCSELSFPVKIYFCVTILSLLSVIGLTIETLVRQAEEDFTISFIQLVGAVFCVYYVSRGILQENRQELVVFVLSILLLMLRSIINFTLLPAGQKPQLLLCLCILLISLHEVTLLHNIISATGVVWGCLKVTVGITAILKELKPLVWVFLFQNVPEVVYLTYLLYTCFPPMEGSTPEPSLCSSHRVKPPQSSCPALCQDGAGTGRCHLCLGAVQVGQRLKQNLFGKFPAGTKHLSLLFLLLWKHRGSHTGGHPCM